MSELSTVAIKDGHRGHFPHHHHPQDAERADRISRLAGLERVATARHGGLSNQALGGTAPGGPSINPTSGYFDANNQPQIFRERSTVGSASATGSVGGRTTWASGSDVYDPDRMSEDLDTNTTETSSNTGDYGYNTGNNDDLVGFGEGARTPARGQSSAGGPFGGFGSPAVGGKARGIIPPHHLTGGGGGELPPSPMTGVSTTSMGSAVSTTDVPTPPHASTETPRQLDPREMNGMTYDAEVVDTANRTPPPVLADLGDQDKGKKV